MNTRLNIWTLVLCGACTLAAPLASAEVVGRVLMTAGETSALREGKAIPLTFGSPIEARDTLQTGQRSNLQVRLTDETILSLREQTQMRIEDYKYSGKPDGDESAVFRLVKGAFRTVTGLIGRSNHARYAVRTPSATIGIRGTMYAAGVCDKDCFNADGSLARDGLYGMVIGQSQGTNKLALTNKTGETIVRQGQVFFVASDSAAPELMLEPPAHLIDKLAGAGKAVRPTSAALGEVGELAGGGFDSFYPFSISVQNGAGGVGGPCFNCEPPLPPVVNPTLVTIQSQGFVSIGGTGIVRGQMLWTTTADMDLHMFTPDNQQVFFGNPTVNFPSASPTATAQLDIDNTQGINHPTAVTTFEGQLHAVENIRVNPINGGPVPLGNYTFFTRNFSGPTTPPIVLVTGDNNVTSQRYNLRPLTSGATSQNLIVTRNPNGTVTYSPCTTCLP